MKPRRCQIQSSLCHRCLWVLHYPTSSLALLQLLWVRRTSNLEWSHSAKPSYRFWTPAKISEAIRWMKVCNLVTYVWCGAFRARMRRKEGQKMSHIYCLSTKGLLQQDWLNNELHDLVTGCYWWPQWIAASRSTFSLLAFTSSCTSSSAVLTVMVFKAWETRLSLS